MTKGCGAAHSGLIPLGVNEHTEVTPEDGEAEAAGQVESAALVPDAAPGMVVCVFCGNPRFRRSHVRNADLKELLLLRLPVRCTRCGQRRYAPFGIAGMALPPKHHGNTLAKGTETWRSWTEPDQRKRRIRPMSTAAEPQARNIEKPREPMRRVGQGDKPVW